MGKIIGTANRSSKTQAHFELPEDQWKNFLAILPSLGYSSASEFLREKVREAIKEARQMAESSSLGSTGRKPWASAVRIVPQPVGKVS